MKQRAFSHRRFGEAVCRALGGAIRFACRLLFEAGACRNRDLQVAHRRLKPARFLFPPRNRTKHGTQVTGRTRVDRDCAKHAWRGREFGAGARRVCLRVVRSRWVLVLSIGGNADTWYHGRDEGGGMENV